MTERYYRNLADAITGLMRRECKNVSCKWLDDERGLNMCLLFELLRGDELYGFVTATDWNGTVVQSGHHANFNSSVPLDLSYVGVR